MCKQNKNTSPLIFGGVFFLTKIVDNEEVNIFNLSFNF